MTRGHGLPIMTTQSAVVPSQAIWLLRISGKRNYIHFALIPSKIYIQRVGIRPIQIILLYKTYTYCIT
jgi:hypothetical protein